MTTITPIIPHKLYQSGVVHESAVEAAGITAVFDLTGPTENPFYPFDRVLYIHWPLQDGPELPPACELDALATLAASLLAAGHVVLVHCFLGLNRSSLLTAAILQRVEGISGVEAVRRIRAARGDLALSNQTFRAHVEAQSAREVLCRADVAVAR